MSIDSSAVLHLARQIVNVGPTSEGSYVVTTFSQAQIDEMLSQQGRIGWVYDKPRSHLTLIRIEPETRPLATYDLRRSTHRQALSDALSRGTIHVCVAESINMDNGMIDGQKIAIDVAPSDHTSISIALNDKKIN